MPSFDVSWTVGTLFMGVGLSIKLAGKRGAAWFKNNKGFLWLYMQVYEHVQA